MQPIVADIHCHPTLKPYGRSFPFRKNSKNPADLNSVYHYDPQSLLDKALNKVVGLTRFSQANMAALRYGNVNLIIASLYPLEKGFVITTHGSGKVIDGGLNLTTGFGKTRIDFLQETGNGYYDDLWQEYQFLLGLDGRVVDVDGHPVKYKLIDSFAQLELAADPAPNATEEQPHIINVMLSFEGAHALYSNYPDVGKATPAIQADVLDNINRIKGTATERNWKHKPVYITFAHHFYNGLCGHEKSLTDSFVKLVTNQAEHLGDPLTDLGREALLRLLDNTNGRRVLIDVKHMSFKTRHEYYDMLETHPELKGQSIPVIISHGAVRGNASNNRLFLDADINFSDEEIVRVGRTNGLFGIQLDERRIASKAEIQNFKRYTSRRKVLYHATELIWRQIQHMVEVLDAADIFAWGIQCIGSDYDGIVNPIDGLWTAEDFTAIEDYLLMHAHNYRNSPSYSALQNPYNKVPDAEEIVSRFMGRNVYDFLSRNC